MNRNSSSSTHVRQGHRYIGMTLACIIVLLSYGSARAAQNSSETPNPDGQFHFTVTHILGLEAVKNNAKGTVSIQDENVVFQNGNNGASEISLRSIRDLRLGESDKQVGGAPMKVGKMAAPFGGGRVVSLFAHKKYDTLTIDYRDANGGFHGAILQLDKDEAHVLRNELINRGAHVPDTPEEVAQQSTSTEIVSGASSAAEGVSASAGWSVQVVKVDSGDVNMEPAFTIAIYENLVRELTKKGGFKQVLRDGDRNASDTPNLLILRTTVEKYKAGSETRRAVTTVSGATKVSVRSQLCTRDGRVVMERVIDGNVRFMGGNLRATSNLAHNVAKNIKRSTLPQTSAATAKSGGINATPVAQTAADPTVALGPSGRQ